MRVAKVSNQAVDRGGVETLDIDVIDEARPDAVHDLLQYANADVDVLCPIDALLQQPPTGGYRKEDDQERRDDTALQDTPVIHVCTNRPKDDRQTLAYSTRRSSVTRRVERLSENAR